MPLTVAMHESSLAHIERALQTLSLDIRVLAFNDAGNFIVDNTEMPASNIEVDYFWLSYHVSGADSKMQACETALQCKSINVLQTFNAGLDDPYYRKLADKGIRICNSSAQAVAISEYVMSQVMSEIHPIRLQRAQQMEKTWQRTPFREISKTNWLIVGYGPIGQGIARRVKAFGASTSIVRRTQTLSEYVDVVGTLADLNTLLPQADIVVLACPLNTATRGIANKEFFSAAKKDCILVNIARGGLIEDTALITALDKDNLACAILDVFHEEPLPEENPLWSHPKVRLTPHTSFNGDGVRDRWDKLFLDNVSRFVNKETLLHEVNPEDIV